MIDIGVRREEFIGFWAGAHSWLFRPPICDDPAPDAAMPVFSTASAFRSAVSTLTIRRQDEHGPCGDDKTLIAYNRFPADDVPGRNPRFVNPAGTAPSHDGGGGNDLKRSLLGIALLRQNGSAIMSRSTIARKAGSIARRSMMSTL
jgi:hypothetical protein